MRASLYSAACALLLLAAPGTAQEIVERTEEGYRLLSPPGAGGVIVSQRVLSASAAIRTFALEHDGRPPADGIGTNSVYTVLARSWLFPRPTVDSIMTGLEGLALRSRSAQVQLAALVAIGAAADTYVSTPVPGATSRLLRIYPALPRALRDDVLDALVHAGDRPQAVAFLRHIATKPDGGEDFPGAAEKAVWRLGIMGPEGAAALRELHDRGLVRDPAALRMMRGLQRTGFRVPQN